MDWITRFVVLLGFLALGVLLYPDSFAYITAPSSDSNVHVGLRLAYLLSFATAWGMSLWVTFIGGIIMFKNLPRHQFGNLQSKMFPAYFGVLAVCGIICLSGFSILHPWNLSSTTERSQIFCLALSLIATLANIFVFEPMTTKIMRERHKIEREESIGDEVGLTKNNEVAKRNPKLANVNKRFGVAHGLSSISNLCSLGGFAIHSWYLANKLSI